MKERKTTTMRFSPKAKELLRQMADKMGISMAAVIEIAIRKLAKDEGLE